MTYVGFLGGESKKGFVFSKKRPDPIVADVDSERLWYTSPHQWFRPLGDDWYIFCLEVR